MTAAAAIASLMRIPAPTVFVNPFMSQMPGLLSDWVNSCAKRAVTSCWRYGVRARNAAPRSRFLKKPVIDKRDFVQSAFSRLFALRGGPGALVSHAGPVGRK
jgi:hypothetical protein